MITVTGGHGDFRQLSELPRTLGAPSSRMEELGGSMVADSPDEVRVRAREQLMQGASQIKLTAGGGVASPHSPLDVSTFTEAELRAAVEAAGNWGTYVAAHAYTSEAIRRAIASGVKVIGHGHLMDDATARLMAEQDIWLSTQPFVDDEDAVQFPPGSDQAAQKQAVTAGTESVYALAKKYGIRTAFGTDILFSQALATRQGAWLARMVRWYTPAEALKMATHDNAELLALTGLRNPYPGRLGVVEEGALADLLLVDGDPIADIDLLADPGNLDVIMKDGRIYKTVASGPEAAWTGRAHGKSRSEHDAPAFVLSFRRSPHIMPGIERETRARRRKASMSNLTERLRDGAHALMEKAGDLQERIRQRARAIWEREGRPDGREHDHWRTAEEEIAAEDAAAAKPAASRNGPRPGRPRPSPRRPSARRSPPRPPKRRAPPRPPRPPDRPGKPPRPATKSASPASAKPRRAAPKKDG